ncbi:MAG: hypothetical protein GX868_15720, partial [Actinobacteria bacterium]|nr:hypothetical protein [Actinomycetota bacterium]
MRAALATLAVLVLAGCGGSEDAVMPDVVGEQLNIAKSEIDQAGYGGNVDVDGGGIAGIVIESNWQVCEQLPAAGELVTETPRLTVERSCSDEASNQPSDEVTVESADESPSDMDPPTTSTTPEPSETSAGAPVYSGPA